VRCRTRVSAATNCEPAPHLWMLIAAVLGTVIGAGHLVSRELYGHCVPAAKHNIVVGDNAFHRTNVSVNGKTMTLCGRLLLRRRSSVIRADRFDEESDYVARVTKNCRVVSSPVVRVSYIGKIRACAVGESRQGLLA